MDRKKEDAIRKVKEQSDIEIKKLNEKIQRLNKNTFDQSKSEERNSMVAGPLPPSSIERTKPADTARSNNVRVLTIYKPTGLI